MPYTAFAVTVSIILVRGDTKESNIVGKKLNSSQKIFLGIGVFAFFGSAGLGVYGNFVGNQVITNLFTSLTVSFSLALAALQIFPKLIEWIRQSLRLWVNIFIACLALGPLVFSGYSIVVRPPDPVKVIKIGVSLPLSGDDMESGNATLNGITLATDGQKNIEGYTISLVVHDDKGDPNDIDAFKKFIKDPQIAAIIGPFNSGVAIKEIPETNARSIPLISPATTADCLTIVDKKTQDCDANKLGAAGNATFFGGLPVKCWYDKGQAQRLKAP